MTIDETVERLRISHTAFERLRRHGGLPTLKIGRSVRIDPDDLDRWILEQRVVIGPRSEDSPDAA